MLVSPIKSIFGILAVVALGTLASSIPAHAVSYWTVFNPEGESTASAAIVTYNSLTDMVSDTNRVGDFFPIGSLGRNIIGRGSDGTIYWNASLDYKPRDREE